MPPRSDLPATSDGALLTSLDLISSDGSISPGGLLLPAGLLCGDSCSFFGDAALDVPKGDRAGDFFSGAWKDIYYLHTNINKM
jgi:hypothetical protein